MSNPKQVAFYRSRNWHTARQAYGESRHWICERCGRPGAIVHHVIHLNPGNIDDPSVSLSFGNFELLCHECHNREHFDKRAHFDENGDLVAQ